MLKKITSLYLALLFTVFLLAFPRDGGYTVITGFKYDLFIAICGGYVLTIAILRMMYVVTGVCPVGRIKTKLKNIPLAAKFLLGYLFFIFLSGLLSVYPDTFRGAFRLEGVLSIGLYVLSCLFVAKYFHPQKWMLFLLGGVIIPFSILAFVQLTGANPFLLYPYGHNFYGSGIYYTGEFLATIGNTGLVAAFISLVAGVLVMALIKYDFWGKWLLAFPLFLTLLLIFMIGVEAAFVAVLAGFALMIPVGITCRKTLANTIIVFTVTLAALTFSRTIIFMDGAIQFASVPYMLVAATGFMSLLAIPVTKADIFSKIPARGYRFGAIFIVISGICTMLVYLWLYGGEQGGMVYEASQVLRGRWEDEFGTRRVYIWRNILERITMSTLLLGTGPDTLGHWDIPYFVRIDDAGRTFITNIDAAHNELLHILATGGVLSLGAYLGGVIIAMVNWFRRPEHKLSAVAGAGVLLYMIQGLFGISQFLTAIFFWACLGVLLSTQVIDNKAVPI